MRENAVNVVTRENFQRIEVELRGLANTEREYRQRYDENEGHCLDTRLCLEVSRHETNVTRENAARIQAEAQTMQEEIARHSCRGNVLREQEHELEVEV